MDSYRISQVPCPKPCAIVSIDYNYLCALANSLAAGNRIAEMIRFLNMNSKNVHLIGHSLGAYVCE